MLPPLVGQLVNAGAPSSVRCAPPPSQSAASAAMSSSSLDQRSSRARAGSRRPVPHPELGAVGGGSRQPLSSASGTSNRESGHARGRDGAGDGRAAHCTAALLAGDAGRRTGQVAVGRNEGARSRLGERPMARANARAQVLWRVRRRLAGPGERGALPEAAEGPSCRAARRRGSGRGRRGHRVANRRDRRSGRAILPDGTRFWLAVPSRRKESAMEASTRPRFRRSLAHRHVSSGTFS